MEPTTSKTVESVLTAEELQYVPLKPNAVFLHWTTQYNNGQIHKVQTLFVQHGVSIDIQEVNFANLQGYVIAEARKE